MNSCPNCGGQLAAVTGQGADVAPWLCVVCSRGFWDAEVTPAAKAAWRPSTRDFGFGPDKETIAEAVRQERKGRHVQGKAK